MSIKYTERLAEAGIEPSVGSVGDSYDNALAETINGLYKAEVFHRRGPWRSFEAVEYATLEWVDWLFNRMSDVKADRRQTNGPAALWYRPGGRCSISAAARYRDSGDRMPGAGLFPRSAKAAA